MATEGVILVEIHDPLIGIDVAGNLVLNTKGNMAATPAAGFPRLVGKGIPTNVAISNAKGGSANISLVTFQVGDISGNAVSGVFDLDVYLSDAATGVGLTSTTASGGIADGASGHTLSIMTAAKALRVQTDATGKYILSITDTAKTTFYPCAVLAMNGITVGAQLTAASYD